ncbi:MAG: hypothetical protein JWM67_379 [Mycobacterium sp.]|nr:hypothetical protein [Mycobacterium sp.]
MTALVVVVAVVVLVASYITWLAGRLDRLHVRCDLARASLDVQLVRRAAAARALATAPDVAALLPGAVTAEVAAAAAAALTTPTAAREPAENRLSRGLRAAFAAVTDAGGAAALPRAALARPTVELLLELERASTRVGVARQFDTDAVRDCRALRAHPVVRSLRLAGSAALPRYFDIDDTAVPPVTPAVATALGGGAGTESAVG